MEEDILNFVSITSADPEKAASYLRLTENNLEQAIQLYFDSPNLDVGVGAGSGGGSSRPPQNAASSAQNPIQIDSDDDMDNLDDPSLPRRRTAAEEDDEAMARRLQEEMYGSMAPESDVRAPMARTTETLVGPGAWTGEDEDVDGLVADAMTGIRGRRQG